jgi:hypothetical protein
MPANFEGTLNVSLQNSKIDLAFLTASFV